VTLVVTGPCGTDTQTKAAYINPVAALQADFTVDETAPCSGASVQFTANCTGTVDTYSWDFGDGTATSSDSNPSHTYQTTNSCTVTLVVTGPCGTDTRTKVAYITANLCIFPPTANAGGPYSGSEADTITLDAGASTDTDGNIILYEWDIDNDGIYEITISDSSCAYIWSDDHNGTITLRVSDNDNQTDTASASVTISNRAPLALTGGPYYGEMGQTITLSGTALDSSPHDTFTYDWDLDGNGFYEILNTQNPSASWNETGTYSIFLKVTDDDGGIGLGATQVIIGDSIPPVVNITSPNNGHDTVTNQSQITISGLSTDTGTGVVVVLINTADPNTGDTANFSFLVTLNPDTNTLIVTARDGAGNTGDDTITIYYYPSCPSPVADFTASDTSGCAPLEVTFIDSSTGDVLTYLWDFGDGDTSTLQSPGQIYNNPGTYTVILTVSDTCGSDSQTRTDYITVEDCCATTVTADFSSDTTTGCAPLTVTFSDSSTGDVLTYLWDFGDGDTDTIRNPIHAYTASGTYTVNLTVSDTCGSDSETKTGYIGSDSATAVIEVLSCAKPTAGFSSLPTSGYAPLEVTFSNLSTGDTLSFLWDFGDGDTSTDRHPTHTYRTANNYTVTLAVTNLWGSDSATVTIEVLPEPTEF